MAATVTFKKDPRAKLTTEIKRLIVSHDDKVRSAKRDLAHIFAHVYTWVDYSVAHGHADTIEAGVARLAATIKRSAFTVEGWYWCGNFMRENKVDPKKADSHAVRTVSNQGGMLSTSERLRCIDLIRRGRDSSEVFAIMRKSKSLASGKAERQAEKMEREKKLTPTEVKLRMTVVAALGRKLFPQRYAGVAIIDQKGEILLEVNGK